MRKTQKQVNNIFGRIENVHSSQQLIAMHFRWIYFNQRCFDIFSILHCHCTRTARSTTIIPHSSVCVCCAVHFSFPRTLTNLSSVCVFHNRQRAFQSNMPTDCIFRVYHTSTRQQSSMSMQHAVMQPCSRLYIFVAAAAVVNRHVFVFTSRWVGVSQPNNAVETCIIMSTAINYMHRIHTSALCHGCIVTTIIFDAQCTMHTSTIHIHHMYIIIQSQWPRLSVDMRYAKRCFWNKLENGCASWMHTIL